MTDCPISTTTRLGELSETTLIRVAPVKLAQLTDNSFTPREKITYRIVVSHVDTFDRVTHSSEIPDACGLFLSV
ncbi:MAG: hypothetical protein J07HB67_02146 [halophilic archaeon J07HB67]|nr:MAG: hypothetical protein J07HB67_02146 [halophilic archaeon J07HB67]